MTMITHFGSAFGIKRNGSSVTEQDSACQQRDQSNTLKAALSLTTIRRAVYCAGMRTPKKRPMAAISQYYLVAYNTAMAAGWLLILLRMSAVVVKAHSRKYADAYDSVQTLLRYFQTGALLEVLHAATGIVRASAVTTCVQVGSRLMLLWGVTEVIPEVRSDVLIASMVISWSLTEIPRYAYFVQTSLRGSAPTWFVWLRYSTFIPLYPTGAGSEWGLLFKALPWIRFREIYSVKMPNWLNFAFDYHTFCVLILLLYVPGLPYMYTHMLRQRSKHLGKARGEAGKARTA